MADSATPPDDTASPSRMTETLADLLSVHEIAACRYSHPGPGYFVERAKCGGGDR